MDQCACRVRDPRLLSAPWLADRLGKLGSPSGSSGASELPRGTEPTHTPPIANGVTRLSQCSIEARLCRARAHQPEQVDEAHHHHADRDDGEQPALRFRSRYSSSRNGSTNCPTISSALTHSQPPSTRVR